MQRRQPETDHQPLLSHLDQQEAALLEERQLEGMGKHYVPVKMNGVPSLALVDSGNIYRNVISLSFCRRLGLDQEDLVPIDTTEVQTAKKGSTLVVIGEVPKPVALRIGGLPFLLKTKPVVISGLNMDINLCGPFLQKHKIDQLHSSQTLLVQGHEVPLQANTSLPDEITMAAVYLDEDQLLPPHTSTYVKARIPAVESRRMTDGIFHIWGEGRFDATTGLSSEDGQVPIASWSTGEVLVQAINNTPEAKTLRKGKRYGFARKVAPHTSPDDMEWAFETLQLGKSPLLDTYEKKAQAAQVLGQYRHLFSEDGSFGKTHLLQHRIVTEDVPPIRCRYRPLNPKMEASLKEQLDQWQAHDVIEPSTSPWSFGLVAVPKKNGKIRWCVDFRRLNNITKKDAFPLPHIEDNLARLAHSRVFSGIDGAGAFHVVEIAEEDREKTAFATPWGSFHFKRMPFGVCNGPATYARLVQLVLNKVPPSMALPYLDDTIIHAEDIPSHCKALAQVLKAHEDAGLKLQPEKCHFFRDEVDYLGHTISADGVRPMKAYQAVVKDWPLPTTRTEVRAFLGKVGYYRRFIQDFARLAGEWTDTLHLKEAEQNLPKAQQNKATIEVTDSMKESFHQLKQALLQAPILAYPRFDQKAPFILDTDWSYDNKAIGGVLSQVQDGQERVIAYGAKKLNSAQSNYPPTKGELFAAIHFMQHWRYYLQYQPFIFRTDHQALKWVKTMEAPSGMIQRWMDVLANFNFTIQYRPGAKHLNADALSRIGHADTAEGEEGEEAEVLVLTASLAAEKQDAVLPQGRDAVAEAQRRDPILRLVRVWLQAGKTPDELSVRGLPPEGQLYAGLLPLLSLHRESGLIQLHWEGPTAGDTVVTCVPEKLVEESIRLAHRTGGHQGIEKTTQRLRQTTFFPQMKSRVHDAIKRCLECQQKGNRLSDQ